ncbi:hypothetical protein QTP88_024143 [Uroleucon formosanum]
MSSSIARIVNEQIFKFRFTPLSSKSIIAQTTGIKCTATRIHQEKFYELNNNNTPPKEDLQYNLALESVFMKERRHQYIDLNCIIHFLRVFVINSHFTAEFGPLEDLG